MTTWDLNRLRYTVRKITGKFDQTQLPDSSVGENNISNPPGIDDYINDFYLYDMPEHLRTLRLKNFYNFVTVPNCGTYNVPENIYSIEPPIYIDNYQFAWYQNPDIFYRIWPELNFIDRNLFTPDGSAGISGNPFTFTLTQTPVQQGTVVIGLNPNQSPQVAGALETFTDQDQPIPLDLPMKQYFVNPGVLISNQYKGPLPPSNPGVDPGTGTIDYLTGAVTLAYVNAPPSGATSSCHYHPYVASRPRDIMFYQQQLFLRPIPNDSYAVKVMAYFMPTTVISAASNATIRPSISIDPTTTASSVPSSTTATVQGFNGQGSYGNTNGIQPSLPTDLPQFNEWWQLIAYGAALKLFIEDGDHEEYARYKEYFEEQKVLAQRKELKQLANQRIQTPYGENNAGAPAFPVFPIY